MIISNPLKDKAVVTFEDNSSTVVYLHYEKIKRACLFCGIMFHNAQDCTIRNGLISRRQRNRQSSADIPSQRFGQWIINEKLIPADQIQNARMGDQATSQDGNDILQRLRQMFAEDPKGKGKVIETPSSKQGQLKIQSANNPPFRKQICDMGFSIPAFIPSEKEKQLVTYSSADQHGEQNHQPLRLMKL